jgi:PIN domain nuclease of toxin-antitoxin system
MNYTLDACALLAFLNDEEGADTIEELLDRAVAGDVFLFMSIINLLEIYYGELRDKGAEVARTRLLRVDGLLCLDVCALIGPAQPGGKKRV